MAIKVQTSHAMLLVFWIGILFILGSIWSFLAYPDTHEAQIFFFIFGLISIFSSINYYKKVGWSELRNDSLGCLAVIIFLSIIRFVFNQLFG